MYQQEAQCEWKSVQSVDSLPAPCDNTKVMIFMEQQLLFKQLLEAIGDGDERGRGWGWGGVGWGL
jgi:hypothetical protein